MATSQMLNPRSCQSTDVKQIINPISIGDKSGQHGDIPAIGGI